MINKMKITKTQLKEIIREEISSLNESYSKTILVDKGGFGEFSLFSEKSKKDILVGERGLGGSFLDELGIEYKVGDKINIKSPTKDGTAYKIYKVKIYKVSNKHFHGKFI